MTLEEFKQAVEVFIEAESITPTAFGKRYANDPLFVFQLREGREPRSSTQNKILEAMGQGVAA